MPTVRDRERGETWPFCEGLPLTEDRRLTPDERTELGRMAWRMTGRACVSTLGGILGVIAVVVALAWASRYWNGAFFVMALVVSSWLVVFPLFLASRNYSVQRARSLFGDLRRGEAREFSGMLDADQAQAAAMRGLLTRPGLEVPPPQRLTLTVLANSRRVWRANGVSCPRWMDAPWVEVAMPPTSVATATIAAAEPQSRALTRAERAELGRLIRGLWVGPLAAAAFVSGLALVVAFTAVTRTLVPHAWATLLHWGFAALVAAGVLLQRLRRARPLRADLRGGIVEARRSAAGDDFETLPASGLVWSESGVPAEWRRAGIGRGVHAIANDP